MAKNNKKHLFSVSVYLVSSEIQVCALHTTSTIFFPEQPQYSFLIFYGQWLIGVVFHKAESQADFFFIMIESHKILIYAQVIIFNITFIMGWAQDK